MFNWLEKRGKKFTEVISCVEGVLIPLKDVKDPAFSSGAIGRGIAIQPKSSSVVSPVDGTIQMIFPTNHAIGIATSDGLEFLIHIGIDTVKLKGEGFKLLVYEGQTVRKGDVIVEVDFDLLNRKGYSTDTMLLLTTDQAKAEYLDIGPYGELVGGKDQTLFKCSMK